jgi:hypothetical protein
MLATMRECESAHGDVLKVFISICSSLAEVVVHEESLRHWRRVGQACVHQRRDSHGRDAMKAKAPALPCSLQ